MTTNIFQGRTHPMVKLTKKFENRFLLSLLFMRNIFINKCTLQSFVS